MTFEQQSIDFEQESYRKARNRSESDFAAAILHSGLSIKRRNCIETVHFQSYPKIGSLVEAPIDWP